MSTAQAKADRPSRIRRWLIRLLGVAVASVVIGWTLQRSAQLANRDSSPAGFARGLLHGILMPIALPNLLVGHDVPIYAPNNTGVRYKLGYTMGVNGCGAIFFGLLYWRLMRSRKASSPSAQ